MRFTGPAASPPVALATVAEATSIVLAGTPSEFDASAESTGLRLGVRFAAEELRRAGVRRAVRSAGQADRVAAAAGRRPVRRRCAGGRAAAESHGPETSRSRRRPSGRMPDRPGDASE